MKSDQEEQGVAEHGEVAGPHSAADFMPSTPQSDLYMRAETGLTVSSNKDDEQAEDGGASLADVTARADIMRASGTAANIVGSAAPALHYALAPFSAVGGAVGAAAGLAQLHEGLSAPSGLTDPHLVAKGSVTASVGTTCMALGLGAAAVPGLFVAALVLGIAGLGAATTVDATMDGLCPQCRDHVAHGCNIECDEQ